MAAAKLKGLGRGLDALLSADDSADSFTRLAIDRVRSGRYQPRTRMDEASLAELAESIRAQGLLQPVLVRPAGLDFEIIAGERRWRAARLAGLAEIPALVRDVSDDLALALALIENIQRENLNALEEASGVQRLIREFGMTHQQAAEAIGRSRSAVTNLLRLLDLAAPVQELLAAGRIDMGHARALLPLPIPRQIELATLIAEKNLSVRDAERLVARLLDDSPERELRGPDRDLLRLQEELSGSLGAAVVIKNGAKGAGKIIIEYRSLDQLDGILLRLK